MKNNTCPLIGKCGGCQLLHLPYEKTIELKKQYVLECFKKEEIKAEIITDEMELDSEVEAENEYYRTRY